MSLRLGSIALVLTAVAAFASVAHAQPTDVAVVVTPTIASVATQAVETPFVGTFTLSGGLKGELTISRKGDQLTLRGEAGGLHFMQTADANGPQLWQVELGSTSGGIATNVGGSTNNTANSSKVFVIQHSTKGGLKGTYTFKNKKTEVKFARKKEVLVLYGTYENGMKVFAVQCQAYYKAKGYNVTLLPGDWGGAVNTLVGAQELGRPFARVIIVSHGGWDGPMFQNSLHTQLSTQNYPDDYWNLARAVKYGTTLDAKLVFSSCHSGGANRYETWRKEYRYTDEIARDTGRTAYGLNGSTSTEWSLNLCKFAEGEGPARQETRVSTATGGKNVMGGNYVGNLPITNQPLGSNP